jgi:hypothetical protein
MHGTVSTVETFRRLSQTRDQSSTIQERPMVQEESPPSPIEGEQWSIEGTKEQTTKHHSE